MIWVGCAALAAVVLVALVRVVVPHRRHQREVRLDLLDGFRLSRHALQQDLAALDLPDAEAVRRRLNAASAQADLVDLVAELELPRRCAFDPAHEADEVLRWPLAGSTYLLPVCAPDAQRLNAGEDVDIRPVRLGNRWVPWITAGVAYDAYAHAWFGSSLDPFREKAARLSEWDTPAEDAEQRYGYRPLGVPMLGEAPVGTHHRLGKRAG